MCYPSLDSLGAVPQIKISAVRSQCALWEYVVHRLFGMVTRTLAVGCESTLVQAARRLPYLGPCYVEHHPAFSWEVCSCWELFSRCPYSIVCCGAVPFIPLFNATTCWLFWVEAFHSYDKTISWLEPTSGAVVVKKWVSLVSFLLVLQCCLSLGFLLGQCCVTKHRISLYIFVDIRRYVKRRQSDSQPFFAHCPLW